MKVLNRFTREQLEELERTFTSYAFLGKPLELPLTIYAGNRLWGKSAARCILSLSSPWVSVEEKTNSSGLFCRIRHRDTRDWRLLILARERQTDDGTVDYHIKYWQFEEQAFTRTTHWLDVMEDTR